MTYRKQSHNHLTFLLDKQKTLTFSKVLYNGSMQTSVFKHYVTEMFTNTVSHTGTF